MVTEARKEYLRNYQRQWMARRRAEFFAGKSCVRCGSCERLELDHIDPKTKTTHAIWSWRYDRRMEEIAKCQVLCHDCHLKKSASEALKGEQNGGAIMSEKTARFILASSQPTRELANLTGLSMKSIQRIRSGARWKHLRS